jgi:hypothetical protein
MSEIEQPVGRRPLAERPLSMRPDEVADMIIRGAFDPYLGSIEAAVGRRRTVIRANVLKDVQNVFGPDAVIINNADGKRL